MPAALVTPTSYFFHRRRRAQERRPSVTESETVMTEKTVMTDDVESDEDVECLTGDERGGELEIEPVSKPMRARASVRKGRGRRR
ncbi:uncharacterized protein DS421_20g698040 [Arachis hypogaea]|nr:uncharacterized protein DS421_20g698040 [Arachis hypogaea]